MTNWLPDFSEAHGPRSAGTKARALADAIAGDIAAGKLRAGDRLPPQRDLAWRLGISVGTVTRAYLEARRRGLVDGQVGSGTYVREALPADAAFVLPGDGVSGVIDLSVDVFASPLWADALRETFAALSAKESGMLLEYQSAAGLARHRAAASQWIARTGFAPDADDVAITMGGQHGIAVAVSALTRPGDVLLVEALHYPPIRAVAEMLGLTLYGVAIDEEGIVPDALDAACRNGGGGRLLYMTPNLQNPTNVVMGPARRAAIADILRRHDLQAIEDDVTGGLLATPPPPIASLAPAQVTFLTSLSKAVAPGLRTGFVVPPPGRREPVLSRIRALGWFAAPLMAEIAARWIEDGTAARLRDAIRGEHRARHALAADMLGRPDEPPQAADSPHLWFRLPEPWRSSGFYQAAQSAGVRVACTRSFSATQRAGDHVRISLSAARNRDELTRALQILAGITRQPPVQETDIL